MERVVDCLIEQGLTVSDRTVMAEYLTYNTTWGMLKKSLYLSSKYPKDKCLSGYTFDDVKNLGLVEYHYKQANLKLINVLEHQIKVSISSALQGMSANDDFIKKVKNDTLRKLSNYQIRIYKSNFKSLRQLEIFLESDTTKIYKIFDILYFSELIELYNMLPESDRILNIFKNINEVRNTVYHHDEILRVFRASKNSKYKDYDKAYNEIISGLNSFENTSLSSMEINSIYNMRKRSLVLEQIALLNSAVMLLSQSKSTAKIRRNVINEYFSEIKIAQLKIEQVSNVNMWVRALTKYILELEDQYMTMPKLKQ